MRVNINSISEAQLRKLEKGLPVQLSYEQIKDQSISDRGHVKVHPETHKKVVAAHNKKKGVRVKLTPAEIDESGAGFRDMWNWVKRQAPKVLNVAKQAVASPFYQSTIKPEVRKLVDTLEGMAPDNAITRIAKAGIEKVGESTGGYGLEGPNMIMVKKYEVKAKTPKPRAKAIPKPRAKTTPKPRAKKAPKPRAKTIPKGGSFLPY